MRGYKAHLGEVVLVALDADAHARRGQLHDLGDFNIPSVSTLFSVLGGIRLDVGEALQARIAHVLR
jgi:hypothetical protein